MFKWGGGGVPTALGRINVYLVRTYYTHAWCQVKAMVQVAGKDGGGGRGVGATTVWMAGKVMR